MKRLSVLFICIFCITLALHVNSKEQSPQSSGKLILEPEGDIQSAVTDQLQQGRWELVMFWATYCPVCKTDFEKLAAFINDNPDLPFTVVGVVVDGIEQNAKAMQQINDRDLNYAHIITDFDHGSTFYTQASNSALIGVPSQLLYDKDNKLVGYSRNAIDIEALELSIDE